MGFQISLYSTVWSTNLFTVGLVMPLALNALVRAGDLISFRIFKVVKGTNTTFYENMKSGMVLFRIQAGSWLPLV